MERWAYLNDSIIPESEASISVLDRGFLYGDGIFETMLVYGGKPFRWDQHLKRLQQGAELLKLALPFSSERLLLGLDQLLSRQNAREAVLRLTVSRGIGPRGYSPKGAHHPTVVMTLHESTGMVRSPVQWKLACASLRLQTDMPLAQVKTCNKLVQIIARAEAEDRGANEALLCNSEGYVVEGASSNLFWLEGETVCTPPLEHTGILPGVTREVLFECAHRANLPVKQTRITLEGFHRADGVFLTLSTHGVVEATALEGRPLKRSPEVVQRLHTIYWDCVVGETGSSARQASNKS